MVTSRASRPFAALALLLALAFVPACATHAPQASRSEGPATPPTDAVIQAGSTAIVARATPSSVPFVGFEWPDDERLRSAGRLRDLDLDEEGGLSPKAERARLRAHFDFVLAWLDQREASSLELALNRLLEAEAEPIEATARAERREALRRARARQLKTLADYAASGVFPLNRDFGARTRPLFVDARDTACAVGHLMRMDGFGAATQRIARDHNGVYVADVDAGPLLAWVATSGLTIEEAAVIQPGYAPPSGPGIDLDALSTAGATSNATGLLIDNLSAARHSVSLPPGVTPTLLETLFPGVDPITALDLLGAPYDSTSTPLGPGDWTNVTLHSGLEHFDADGGSLESFYDTSPIASPWLFWNATNAGGFHVDPGSSDTVSWFELSYEVSVATAGYGIDAALFQIPGGFWGTPANRGDELHFEVLVESVGDLPLVAFQQTGGVLDPFGEISIFRSDAFAVQEAVRVTVRGGQELATLPTRWSNMRQDFRVVPIPEPSASLLLGLGLIALARRRAVSRR